MNKLKNLLPFFGKAAFKKVADCRPPEAKGQTCAVGLLLLAGE